MRLKKVCWIHVSPSVRDMQGSFCYGWLPLSTVLSRQLWREHDFPEGPQRVLLLQWLYRMHVWRLLKLHEFVSRWDSHEERETVLDSWFLTLACRRVRGLRPHRTARFWSSRHGRHLRGGRSEHRRPDGFHSILLLWSGSSSSPRNVLLDDETGHSSGCCVLSFTRQLRRI